MKNSTLPPNGSRSPVPGNQEGDEDCILCSSAFVRRHICSCIVPDGSPHMVEVFAFAYLLCRLHIRRCINVISSVSVLQAHTVIG